MCSKLPWEAATHTNLAKCSVVGGLAGLKSAFARVPETLPTLCAQGVDKERFNTIKQELSQIGTQFSNNLLDATKAFRRVQTLPKP